MNTDFKQLTDNMDKILERKNEAYGNAYDKSLDDWGLGLGGARLEEKLGRIKKMVKSGTYVIDDESVLDDLFDLAGYSFLFLRYLINNNLVSADDVKKVFS